MATTEEINKKIKEIEEAMNLPDFWSDKEQAQNSIKELESLKDELLGVGKYDKGSAYMTIFSGAGGDDAEDFSRILFEMYVKFFNKKAWNYFIIHKNENDHGGYRNISLKIDCPNKKEKLGPYGILKNESGVHRLVRVSPFNAKKLRHTSFSMVEVVPDFSIDKESSGWKIPEDEIKIEYSKSSGPGGQNVNKRETAVRAVHIPTGIAVHVETERSQAQNKEHAISFLTAKIFKKMEDEKKSKEKGLYISKNTQIEWGNQIRSYVMHPYKMVKDHRTGVEKHDIDKVLEGNLEDFIEAEKDL